MNKKKVLIVTKFYYRRGGDCIYALNLEELLRRSGHEVAVFAMQYPDNLPSVWSGYWPAEVSFGGGIRNKLTAVGRTLGMGEVKRRFGRLLNDFKPDVVHLNNIHSYLSPVVAEMAHKRGIRVVWTLHDYKLICPAYSCLRAGKVCEDCIGGSKLPVARTRCMKGSLAASAIAYIEALRWNRRRLQRYTDVFICPSAFMAEKMAADGFDKSKLRVLSNFITDEMAQKLENAADTPGQYYCYVGRLSAEKGVETLLRAAVSARYPLVVAGDGPMRPELEERYGEAPNIRFTGHIGPDEIRRLLTGARFSVIASEWYENNPLGVIESLCAGTPVLGAAIGGIPELLDRGNGLTFESGSAESLAKAIEQMWREPQRRGEIAAEALGKYTAARYYEALISQY